jgi:hypothetical protein
MERIRHMRHFVRRNKYWLFATALLVAGSGCVGAVKETNQQLTEDALKPITVPVEQYGKAKETLGGVQEAQEEKNRQIEEAQ